jgi:hypothetical protein
MEFHRKGQARISGRKRIPVAASSPDGDPRSASNQTPWPWQGRRTGCHFLCIRTEGLTPERRTAVLEDRRAFPLPGRSEGIAGQGHRAGCRAPCIQTTGISSEGPPQSRRWHEHPPCGLRTEGPTRRCRSRPFRLDDIPVAPPGQTDEPRWPTPELEAGRTFSMRPPTRRTALPPFVTVTLHPLFSGQTEKPGELRGRWKSVATPRPQGEPSIPHAPSGTEGETAGRKKGEGLPSPP